MAANRPEGLRQLDPRSIDPNPDNPRMIFRQTELLQLEASIEKSGILVPLSVYRAKDRPSRHVLIDGERRLRCALKLSLDRVPALVQPEPSPLENILTMFNVHNVRVDWDLMPIALKLRDVQRMLRRGGMSSSPADLAGLTGVSLATVKRALELLELPRKYQTLLLDEAKKPKDQQEVTADLFIEIKKAMRTVRRYVPAVFERVTEDEFLDSMYEKYRRGVVDGVTSYREVSKIARAEKAGGSSEEVLPVLVELVRRPARPIRASFESSVGPAYESRDLTSRASALADRLEGLKPKPLPRPLRAALERLREQIDRLI